MSEYELYEARGSRIDMESQDDVEAAKKQSPLRVVEVDFVFSLRRIFSAFLFVANLLYH